MNAIALSPEQFIFAQDAELKTTSLKIAEAFGKAHAHVLRDIDKIITQVSDSFGKSNFGFSEYEQENNLGLMTKYRMCELTKDGFMIVVMSYTGAKAMAIKEAYINAFNFMAEKLFPKRPGLVELPKAPRAKFALPGGLTLEQQDAINDLIAERVAQLPLEQQGGAVMNLRSALVGKYDLKGVKHGYKNIPAEHFTHALNLLARIELTDDGFVTLPKSELSALVDERAKAITGELLEVGKPEPLSQQNSITINLAPLDKPETTHWIVSQHADLIGMRMISSDNTEQVIKELTQNGYIVVKKTDAGVSKMVMDFIPAQQLPILIETAAKRLKAIQV